MTLLSVLKLVVSHYHHNSSFYIANQIEESWRYAGFRQVYALPVQWHNSRHSGQIGTAHSPSIQHSLPFYVLATEVIRGAEAVWRFIHPIVGDDLFQSMVTLAAVLIAAVMTYPQFWWIWLPPIPLFIYLNVTMGYELLFFLPPRMGDNESSYRSLVVKKQDVANKLDSAASRILHDGVSNLRVVKSFGKEDMELRRYALKWSAHHHYEHARSFLDFGKVTGQNLMQVNILPRRVTV